MGGVAEEILLRQWLMCLRLRTHLIWIGCPRSWRTKERRERKRRKASTHCNFHIFHYWSCNQRDPRPTRRDQMSCPNQSAHRGRMHKLCEVKASWLGLDSKPLCIQWGLWGWSSQQNLHPSWCQLISQSCSHFCPVQLRWSQNHQYLGHQW